MILLLEKNAPEGASRDLLQLAARLGLPARTMGGSWGRQAVEVDDPVPARLLRTLRAAPHVEELLSRPRANPLVELEGDEGVRPVRVGDLAIGGGDLVLAAGPCAVESEDQVEAAALAAARSGARLLRGGAYKPRTRPGDFQGLGLQALRWMRAAADRHGLLVVTEALDPASCDEVAEWADVIQIGARTMQATSLLKAAARSGRPVLLKRGLSATLDEWLGAAEYLAAGGAPGVILCERGSRSFETSTRFSLDVGVIAAARLRTHLPILADPSHPAGRRALVRPLARAAIAAGADGLLVEAHPDPSCARCDGPQALLLDELEDLAREMADVGASVGRTFADPRERRAASGV
ncbi:3-deoxy-7-phosphoheptulonate synthase [Vulgatibacter incomptus]|uniref:2-keto-3-deoxy-D-arabino-heptulosonate-7-phosphate synthase I beta n=1 Tax=Vulgatibacter incomptus TaxID=1391653 RepID=A0A0K1P8V0_9BACT|nr:3-deoxy-7-phosphoheptulonate synthase [Vulgatibacter incomptus]AKU89836.1 2-keto-3-deoxy-D-arabino-heptulosonate-7-phosphate synthase I beta [Vulgatibacter incomptus]